MPERFRELFGGEGEKEGRWVEEGEVRRMEGWEDGKIKQSCTGSLEGGAIWAVVGWRSGILVGEGNSRWLRGTVCVSK